MTLRLAATAILLMAIPCAAQTPPLAARVNEVLNRLDSGHSPSADDIAAIQSLDPAPDAPAVAEALPAIRKALASHDGDVRSYALTLLTALEAAPVAPAAPPQRDFTAAIPREQAPKPDQPPAITTAHYPPAVAAVLTPAIPEIAAHLTDDSQANRLLTTAILAGFIPNPPTAVYPPLLAFLHRDAAIGPTGAEVVADLLTLGPITAETATTVANYLNRRDQTSSTRSSLVDSIANKPYQSLEINQALLAYLNSDDNSLRARVILSLPQLELSPETFTELKNRISELAAIDPASGQENLQVITAAKAVTSCWRSIRMTSGCPNY
jgi:hypothetical protein